MRIRLVMVVAGAVFIATTACQPGGNDKEPSRAAPLRTVSSEPAYSMEELQAAVLTTVPGMNDRLGPETMTVGEAQNATRASREPAKVSPASCQSTYEGMQLDGPANQRARNTPGAFSFFKNGGSVLVIGLIQLPKDFSIESFAPRIPLTCSRMTVPLTDKQGRPTDIRMTLRSRNLGRADLPSSIPSDVAVTGASLRLEAPDGSHVEIRSVVLSKGSLMIFVGGPPMPLARRRHVSGNRCGVACCTNDLTRSPCTAAPALSEIPIKKNGVASAKVVYESLLFERHVWELGCSVAR